MNTLDLTFTPEAGQPVARIVIDVDVFGRSLGFKIEAIAGADPRDTARATFALAQAVRMGQNGDDSTRLAASVVAAATSPASTTPEASTTSPAAAGDAAAAAAAPRRRGRRPAAGKGK